MRKKKIKKTKFFIITVEAETKAAVDEQFKLITQFSDMTVKEIKPRVGGSFQKGLHRP